MIKNHLFSIKLRNKKNQSKDKKRIADSKKDVIKALNVPFNIRFKK
jgi:hypothetical protein